ncbi:TetR/AcrR family transcriptional regulator [Enterococcus crotali]|uniref:TetR/AcrR family transcriptional regulator n=1 Tax=Enterococcus crotali TaxID=1453587 RepID=UPI00046FD935|nr:TetR/AcrR family transcriptional regulator [Enterococcus crotali]
MNKQLKKSEITKLKLKEAASQLFVSKNFDDTSISDITKQAGYAVGSFYKHWKRKEDLLLELWYDATTCFMLETAESLILTKTFHEFSQHMVERVLTYGDDPFIKKYFAARYSLEVHDESAMSDAFDLYVKNIYQQLLFLHHKTESQQLWEIAIAVADLLNGHVLNANNFGKNSLAILEKEQLIMVVEQLVS